MDQIKLTPHVWECSFDGESIYVYKEEVLESYRRLGWTITPLYTIEQLDKLKGC